MVHHLISIFKDTFPGSLPSQTQYRRAICNTSPSQFSSAMFCAQHAVTSHEFTFGHKASARSQSASPF
jgi:hypothetical protein